MAEKRNKAFYLCKAAGLNPELEKIGLLKGEGMEQLRPADVFVPSLRLGQQAALDFAVTSGMRRDMLEHSAEDNIFAVQKYSEKKKTVF